MAFFANFFKGTPKKKIKSIKNTGLPIDWHNELLTEQVFNYLFKEQDNLTDKNLIKKNIGPLWNNSNLPYKQKMKMLYDFVEKTYGTVNERKEKAMMSKAAISLRQAYNAKKKNVGSLIYDFTRVQQYAIKPLDDDVVDFFNTIARIYEGDVYGSKLGSVIPKPKGKAPEYVNPKSKKLLGKRVFESKPSSFDKDARRIGSGEETYNLDYRLPKKGTLPPPPTKTRSEHKKAPLRKSSVTGKLTDELENLKLIELHEHFRQEGQQGWENTDAPLPPHTPRNSPLKPEDDDWGEGGRKRRRRKSRKKKSNKRKKRKTRRKYKKKTRKRKNKRRRRKSRKRYKK